jgi:hypothetical protein
VLCLAGDTFDFLILELALAVTGCKWFFIFLYLLSYRQ